MSPHVFRLRPAPHCRTAIESYSFKILPDDHFINWQQDPFGNFLARVVFNKPATELILDVELIARLEVFNPFDFFVEEYAEKFPFTYDTQLKKELIPYLETTESGPLLMEWIEKNRVTKPTRIVDFLVGINQQLWKDIAYSIRLEPGVQTSEESLGRKLGSCRDSAWLLVQILRHMGLAARFVSGYLVQLKADEKSLDGPSGPPEDFTDLHAWTEVYVPGAGWIGLDPTSGLFAGEGHIPLAATPDYQSAAPVNGATDVCKVEFSYLNQVTRIYEDPRITKPYREEQWENILSTGNLVEEDLQRHDVRMTMGGEPTFVSIDDMESEQWNSAADGPDKRRLSLELIHRLSDRFAPGSMLHFGQGKWYPGELFPRWQYAMYWRKDGIPLWKNRHLIAKENDTPITISQAEAFSVELAYSLGVGAVNISPAYEDPIYWMLEEGKVPLNMDPLSVNLKDPVERITLAQHLAHGLNNPVGFVLPLTWNPDYGQWQSCEWSFRRKHLFLIPGNSPLGLRLPLKSLPAKAKNRREDLPERSTFEELPPLNPDLAERIKDRYKTISRAYEAEKIPENQEEEEDDKKNPPKLKKEKDPDQEVLFELHTIRTALSIQVRDGMLYVFLPPVKTFDEYLDLVSTVESVSLSLNIPVRIEGYTPPHDSRIEKLVVSPDPGVIEVNIHPSSNWNELVEKMTALYEEAKLTRLGTEKFMLDGKHTGTGGGNHVTIGGRTPADSPILRRPDLLRSLITYWQHHPALSYLFSGSFIGPTSQAPRVDEGREDRLYELEIAFSQLPEHEDVPFWLVDRIFRNLLTDLTGNTHRAEFCIDKLYSPDSSTGRLGILEFRAFDMPPHRQMCLVQLLLVRALIAAFWKKPYKRKLVRWGTQLYDRFMLPHFLQEDMREIVQDLNDAGYPFDISWFDPFFEFRFPHYGTIQVQQSTMEVRSALEPWHVLGEEVGNFGTARFVDSSLERIEVKLKGIVEGRHILLCNGCRVPLSPTTSKGVFVAGIRYKAWNPPSALHPTVGVDTPLVLDIYDTWNNRSLGGCTYFVSHPGGRSYDSYPVNSFEAESRRISRFWNFGHIPEQLEAPRQEQRQTGASRFVMELRRAEQLPVAIQNMDGEFPVTLDLRKFWSTKLT
jgi:uncharacterized protein (DUF2126 family)/transglutaminase-like putative cysteine protease